MITIVKNEMTQDKNLCRDRHGVDLDQPAIKCLIVKI